MVSYVAAQWTREIRLVIGQGMRPVFAGITTGLGGAFVVTRYMTRLLFGVQPADPLTFASVVLVVEAVGPIACWAPAYRAARVDPLSALRAE